MTGARLRVVLDTNLLVSAILSPWSVPGRAFRLAAATAVLLVSGPTLAEAQEVFRRPKFDHLVSLASRTKFLDNYRAALTLVPIVSRIKACRDARDDKFLDLAVDGRGDLIVTGDNDLLALHPFREILILTPQEFLARAERPG